MAVVGLVLIAVGAIILAIASRSRRAAHHRERAWRPRELRDAEIAYAEQTFSTRTPFPLVAKLDRALRAKNLLWLAELKTRAYHRVYMADIIEMSAQRYALEEETGEAVSPNAYVVTQNPTTANRRTHLVQLLSRSELTAIADRRERILAGAERPRAAWNRRLCDSCAFFEHCRPDRNP